MDNNISIIIIEDRLERMDQILKNRKIDLSTFKKFLKICDNEFLKNLKDDFNENKFENLSGFNVIATHRSAWTQSELDLIKEQCSILNIHLVLFSGGITGSFYSDFPCSLLTIDVDDFYSNNLILFLNAIKNDEGVKIYLLQYGKQWELNILLDSRNKVTVFLNKNENINEIMPYKIQSSEYLALPPLLYKIQIESEYPMEWFNEGIKVNAANKLIRIKNDLNEAIHNKIFKL